MKSPAFVSRPHFLHADHSYLQQFQYGINPDHTKHDSSFWLEPKSSIPVKVNMRLQLNILLRKVEGIEYLFKNLQEVMYPVFWFEVCNTLLLYPINKTCISSVHIRITRTYGWSIENVDHAPKHLYWLWCLQSCF